MRTVLPFVLEIANTLTTLGGTTMTNYNAYAVNTAIAASNRAGRRISKGEANVIHRLLKGRERIALKPVATCHECGRVFDLLNPDDANESVSGHDCEGC